MHCCRIVNGIKNKNIKNSLGAMWNASHLGLFLFAFSDNLISEDWFFAEGERFLSFWRCHRPRWGGRRWCCGVADSSLCLKSDIPHHQRQVRSTGIAKRLFFMFLFQSSSISPLSRKHGEVEIFWGGKRGNVERF